MTVATKREPDGRLADNIVYFARALRHAGLRVGPASVEDAIRAIRLVGFTDRDDFFWMLHAIFVRRREDHAVFAETFRLFWRSRELVEKMLQMFSPRAPDRKEKAAPKAGEKRVAEALFQDNSPPSQTREVPQIEVDSRFSVSEREVLRTKDFAQMSARELAEAKRAIAAMRLPDDALVSRRFRPSTIHARIDARAMLKDAARLGGDVIAPRFQARRIVHPPLVVIADISGSMSQYSRIFLHFMHALLADRRRGHAFVFGTRLTNLTRQLQRRDPDEALALCSGRVADWSGGTRIGDALHVFNREWSRRVLGQGASVVLITDGLERDDTALLDVEMNRLHLSCRRLIWLNPLLRFDGFEPRAKGVQVMLNHVDQFRAAHTLDALSDLCAALSSTSPGDALNPRRLLAAEKERARERARPKPIVELGAGG